MMGNRCFNDFHPYFAKLGSQHTDEWLVKLKIPVNRYFYDPKLKIDTYFFRKLKNIKVNDGYMLSKS